jgi:spermidine synthase
MKNNSHPETLHGIKKVNHLYNNKVEKGVAIIAPMEVKDSIHLRLQNLRYIRDAEDWFCVDAGNYTRLVIDGQIMMTDTGMECYSNREFVKEARGKVLVAGLGIGLILYNILDKAEVTEIVVIEKYSDLIDIVAPEIKNHPKIKIIHADIDEWNPEKKEMFDTIYFDIWADISTDNLPHIAALEKRFKKHLNKGGWMNSWMKQYLKRRERRGL